MPKSLFVSKKRWLKGFNLIEAAIVLGVVGLIIGGIWVAATAVSDKFKWSQTVEGYAFIVDKAMRDLPAQTISVSPDDSIMPWFIRAVSVPAGWEATYNDPGNPATYRLFDPYGYPMFVNNQMLFTTTPVINVGYISPLYRTNGTLPNLHCARMYHLLKSFSSRYRIVRWDSVNPGCSPDSLSTVLDFSNSACCPGTPIAQFAAMPGY